MKPADPELFEKSLEALVRQGIFTKAEARAARHRAYYGGKRRL